MASNPVAKPCRNGSGLSTAISLPKGNQSHPEVCSKIEQILMIRVHVLGMLDDPPENENGAPATKTVRTETVVICSNNDSLRETNLVNYQQIDGLATKEK